jgi:F0F1-type ATP synthase assembly protein I
MENPPKSQSDQDSNQADGPNENVKKLGLFTVILSDLIAYIGTGFGLGYLAWAKLNFPFWVMLLSSITGLILAFYKLYLISKRNL